MKFFTSPGTMLHVIVVYNRSSKIFGLKPRKTGKQWADYQKNPRDETIDHLAYCSLLMAMIKAF